MYSNRDGLDEFLMQDYSDDTEAEITQFWTCTDGYAVNLTYSFDAGIADGTELAACLTSETAVAQSCWAFTLTSGEPDSFISYYVTSNIGTSLDLSTETAVT